MSDADGEPPKPRRRRRARKQLPDHILPLPNADKTWHEQWEEKRNWLNFPHPYRAVLLGTPGMGKSTVVKNLLLRADPPFTKLLVVHVDPNYTQEYDDVEGELIAEIPDPEDFDGEEKTMVVLDDLEFKTMDREQRRRLDRLFGYVSTHKNVSAILTAQDPFSIPTIARRCADLLVVWPSADHQAMANLASKCGRSAQDFRSLFALCRERPSGKSSVWIDLTPKSPAPVRIDGYTQVRLKADGA